MKLRGNFLQPDIVYRKSISENRCTRNKWCKLKTWVFLTLCTFDSLKIGILRLNIKNENCFDLSKHTLSLAHNTNTFRINRELFCHCVIGFYTDKHTT